MERVRAAVEAGFIRKELGNAAIKEIVKEVFPCSGCFGRHAQVRNTVFRNRPNWKSDLEVFDLMIQAINRPIESKFKIKRVRLCYMCPAEADEYVEQQYSESFARAQVYNAVDSAFEEMLNCLRYAAPFQDLGDVANLTLPERQIGAVSKLYEEREKVQREQEPLKSRLSQDTRAAMERRPDVATSLMVGTAIAYRHTIDFEEVQSKLPRNLRVKQENVSQIKRMYEKAADVGEKVESDGGVGTERGNRRVQKFLESLAENAKREADEEREREEKYEDEKRSRMWGKKDKTGKIWRFRNGRYLRLSLQYTVVRAFNGAIEVAMKVKREHPAPPGFQPDFGDNR